jgi:predicted phage terminase large subunit-like protein
MIELYDGLDALPATLRMYGASDYATMAPVRGKKEPDFTEHGIWGMDHLGDLWAVDWWFGQVETDVGINAFVRLMSQYKPIRWWHEGGLIDKAIGPAVRRAMRESGKFVVLEGLPSIQDKSQKLQSFHARASAGTVHFPIKRPWAERVIEQLVKVPTGRWDDGADVCGLIGRGVDQMIDPQLPVAHARPLLIPFTEKWIEYNDRNQKPKVRYF